MAKDAPSVNKPVSQSWPLRRLLIATLALVPIDMILRLWWGHCFEVTTIHGWFCWVGLVRPVFATMLWTLVPRWVLMTAVGAWLGWRHQRGSVRNALVIALAVEVAPFLMGPSMIQFHSLIPWNRWVWLHFSIPLAGGSAWLTRRIARRLKPALNTTNEACSFCGYNLVGNTTGICPECGTAIPDAMRAALQRIEFKPPAQ
ncbi:hypothetical protein RAS2_04520 [Phycisphaerae bacterium RAS2]|nr:hypothetical protein RAS2_04520 [Phycisphaerae bacterium RAS2]